MSSLTKMEFEVIANDRLAFDISRIYSEGRCYGAPSEDIKIIFGYENLKLVNE